MTSAFSSFSIEPMESEKSKNDKMKDAWSPERRAAQRARMKERWKLIAEGKMPAPKVVFSEERKAAARERMKTLWADPKKRADLSQKLKERFKDGRPPFSEESRKRMRDAALKNWKNPEFRKTRLATLQSEEYRNRMSERARLSWKNRKSSDPNAGRGHKLSDETRKRQSESAKRERSTPEGKARMKRVLGALWKARKASGVGGKGKLNDEGKRIFKKLLAESEPNQVEGKN